MDSEQLIKNLFLARKNAKEQKIIWHDRAIELKCEKDISLYGDSPCYYIEGDDDLWCENCKKKTAHREIYHAACRSAGYALSAALRAGKKIALLETSQEH